jgi:hypothetical protein
MWNKIISWAIALFITFIGYSQSPLCTSYPTQFCCEYVSSVTINGQSYTGSNGYAASSGGNPPGYYDYTGGAIVPTITAGQNISISYVAQTNGNYMEYFKLWVDFNGNGVLSDAGEQVYAYNVSWLGTKTVTATFQVPTTVFNGQVYMRFMMVYANVPALCGTYAYGNTFDFKTNITGAIDPYNHSGFVYGSEGIGIPNVPVKLLKKLTSETNYTLHGTYNTNTNGQYNITTNLNATSYNFQIVIDNLTVANPNITDAQFFNQKILTQGFTSKDYYRLNTNGNNILTISDIYEVYQKTFNVPWESGVPTYRLFNQIQWNLINSSYGDLRSTYPGTQSITIQSPQNSGTSNIYLIRTGYAN